MSVCVDANITGTFRNFFLKFIINDFNVYYKISMPVDFCPVVFFPGGLLSGVGIFSGLLSGGLMSGGLLSVHRQSGVHWSCYVLLFTDVVNY